MNFLLKFSQSIREGVRSGQIEIQGGIYHLETGSVEFLGKSPAQKELLESAMPLPPSMVVPGDADRGVHGVRTGADERVPSDLALKMLKAGIRIIVQKTDACMFCFQHLALQTVYFHCFGFDFRFVCY